MMQALNLPTAELNIQKKEGKLKVFDLNRKKFVALTPEEWVRQHFLSFLIVHQGFASGLIGVEVPVKVNSLSQRADLVVYNKQGKPVMIVECKAAHVPITRAVFDQAARYNMPLRVEYLVVTNGMQHFCARLKGEEGQYELLQVIPSRDEVIGG